MAALLGCILWQWGHAGFILTKAYLARFLIADAWGQSLSTGQNIKPWPWADTWPVAKIVFPNGQTNYVLAGAAGNSLAFGPGHNSSTPLPGTYGTSVIGGHRDTHFAVLQHLNLGEQIHIQDIHGKWKLYKINRSWIANSEEGPLGIEHSTNQLLLVTCYPFNSVLPNGNQRFIVQATQIFKF